MQNSDTTGWSRSALLSLAMRSSKAESFMCTRSGGSERFVGRALPAASGQARPTCYNIGKNTEKRRAIFGLTEPGLSPNRAQFCHCEILREGVDPKISPQSSQRSQRSIEFQMLDPAPGAQCCGISHASFPVATLDMRGFFAGFATLAVQMHCQDRWGANRGDRARP